MRARILPIVLVVLALVTAGCSGKDDGKKAWTEARLQGYLLTDEDVPDGFVLDESEDEEEPELSGCLGDTDDTVPPQAEASVDFATENGLQQLSHEVSGYEEGKAVQAMAEGRELVERCKTFEETLEGTPVKGSITETAAPDLGDEAVAFSLQANLGDIEMFGELIAVRQGELVTAVSLFNVGGPPSREQLLQQIQRAVQRAADVEATQD